jgi:hypothetical protein
MASYGGRFWVLNADGNVYDLHSDRNLLAGFMSGDKVEVSGRIREDWAYIHMCGIIFELQSIRHYS